MAAVASAWRPPVAAADQVTPVVINCGESKVKPDRLVVTCADNTLAIDKIDWSSWSISGAKGTGIEYEDDCVPNCAQGHAIYSPATVTLSGAAEPDFRYTSGVITNLNTGQSIPLPM
jgi:hypothetical protein